MNYLKFVVFHGFLSRIIVFLIAVITGNIIQPFDNSSEIYLVPHVSSAFLHLELCSHQRNKRVVKMDSEAFPQLGWIVCESLYYSVLHHTDRHFAANADFGYRFDLNCAFFPLLPSLLNLFHAKWNLLIGVLLKYTVPAIHH